MIISVYLFFGLCYGLCWCDTHWNALWYSGSDPDLDSITSVDPDPESGSRSKRTKMTRKNIKKLRNFMFWRTGCSLFSLMSITLRTSLGKCLGSAFTVYMTAQIQARIHITKCWSIPGQFMIFSARGKERTSSFIQNSLFRLFFMAYLADWLTNMASMWLLSLVRILSRSPPCSSSSLVRPSNSGRSNTNRMKDRLPGNTRLIPVHNSSRIRLIPHSNIRHVSA